MQEVKIDYNGTIIMLYAKYEGVKKPWDGKYEKDAFIIFVRIEDNSTNFMYYCNKAKLDEQELASALWCFLTDGISYENAQDIDDFQSEFGYTKVSECQRAYEGCKKAHEKWKKFNLDACDLANWLQEKYEL